MTDVQHIDGGKKFDLEKGVIGGLSHVHLLLLLLNQTNPFLK